MKTGDRYIIEIAEVKKYHTDNGDEFELGRVKGFKALTLDESALKKLEPVETMTNNEAVDWIDAIWRSYLETHDNIRQEEAEAIYMAIRTLSEPGCS